MGKIKKLLAGSHATSLVVKKHHDKFVVFFYRSPNPLFGERKDVIMEGYSRYVDGGYPDRELTPADCEPVNKNELREALDAIQRYDAEMADFELEQEEWLKEAEEELAQTIREREANRPEGDNTVYADDVAYASLRKEAFEWVDYIIP